jgi:hypothetical protein
MDQMKALQKEFDDNTQHQRKNLDELKSMLKNEEAGYTSTGGSSANPGTLNPSIQQSLDKFK